MDYKKLLMDQRKKRMNEFMNEILKKELDIGRPSGYRRLYISVPIKIWEEVEKLRCEYNSRNALIVDLIRNGLKK